MDQHPNPSAPTNGGSSLHDLFALTDEQILEIEPEAQDVEVSADAPAFPAATNTVISSLPAEAGAARNLSSSYTAEPPQSKRDSSVATLPQNDSLDGDAPGTASPRYNPTGGEKPVTRHQSSGAEAPPQWLAERMADPQFGAEARDLWNGSQQARQEAAAFREVFAKPEEARTAAQRARLLDDIDHAYFGAAGKSAEEVSASRTQLAQRMLREDPAAFREMVFAGLRALEQAGSQANGSVVGAQHAAPRLGNTFTAAPPAISANAASPVGSRHAVPAADSASDAHLAAYAAFERAANTELERSVGGAIDRTLDQALPNAGRADAVAMKTRLAATIRQDIEKALQRDRQLGEQVAQVLSSRRLTDDARAQVVRLIGERAQQLVPSAAKRVLNEWTQATLASHRDRLGRTEAVSARREVEPASATPRTTTSPGVPRGTAAASTQHGAGQQNTQRRAAADAARGSRRVDYRRLSDEQILDL